MNSLERSMARRREADAERITCVDVGSRPTIGFHKWEAERWLFPWSHLDSIVCDEEDAFTLAFTRYRVAVTGANLAAIWDDLASLNVTALRELPAAYRQRVGNDAAFVSSIVVSEATKTRADS